jgi:hypothetical protein
MIIVLLLSKRQPVSGMSVIQWITTYVGSTTHFKDTVKLCCKHDVALGLELASHECFLAVELAESPKCQHVECRGSTKSLTLPDAISVNVSSDRMRVTSALGLALPLYTVPVFFKSTVQVATSFASLVTWNSKMPFVCKVQRDRHRLLRDR